MMPWIVSGTLRGPPLRDPIPVAVPPQDPEVQQGLGDLFDEERHAFRLLQQRLAQRGRRPAAPSTCSAMATESASESACRVRAV